MSKTGAIHYEFGFEVDEFQPYFTQEGEDREDNPNQYIANLTYGSVAGFKYFTFKDATKISVKVRGTGKGEFHVSQLLNGEKDTSIPIDLKGKEWVSFQAPFKIDNGVRALYFTYLGEGAIDMYSLTIE